MSDTANLRLLMQKDNLDKTTQSTILLFLRTLMNETFLNKVIEDVGNVKSNPTLLSVVGIVSDMDSYYDAVQSGYKLLRALDRTLVHRYLTFQMVCVVCDNLDIDTTGLIDDYDDIYRFFDSHFSQTIEEYEKKVKIICGC